MSRNTILRSLYPFVFQVWFDIMPAAEYTADSYMVTLPPDLYDDSSAYTSTRCLPDGDYVLVLGSSAGTGWRTGARLDLTDGLGNPVRAGRLAGGYEAALTFTLPYSPVVVQEVTLQGATVASFDGDARRGFEAAIVQAAGAYA
mgnify:CR=1 FL=1